ncbi:MAG: CHAP domain-containing protein [Treponema sp.]|jgi:cell wall-associated NlpC family hydrolase|nr:CHAP domain-containing protein [Treponema sp.]
MNLKEFVEKYRGKPVDFDGVYGAQCVDLVRQYFKDAWKLPKQPEPAASAADFYFRHSSRNTQREYLDCTAFADGKLPPQGSVVIFGPTSTNKYGHIAICLATHADKLVVFEQDGIANQRALNEGREQKGAHEAEWTYSRLVGWLTRKEGVNA